MKKGYTTGEMKKGHRDRQLRIPNILQLDALILHEIEGKRPKSLVYLLFTYFYFFLRVSCPIYQKPEISEIFRCC